MIYCLFESNSFFFFVRMSFFELKDPLAYSIYCYISFRWVINDKFDSYREWKISINWEGSLKNIFSSYDESSKFSDMLMPPKFCACCYYFYIFYKILFLSSSLMSGLRLSKKSLYLRKFWRVYRLDIFLPVRSAWIYSFYLIMATFSFFSLVWSSAFFIASLAYFLFSFR